VLSARRGIQEALPQGFKLGRTRSLSFDEAGFLAFGRESGEDARGSEAETIKMSPKCARWSACGRLNIIVATKRLPPADVYMPPSFAMDLHVT